MLCVVPQVESLSSWGWTPLHYAAYRNQIEMTKLLLSHNAGISTADSEVSAT